MGKAADNERKKLKATFYNNIGAGLILTGCLVPYLTVVGKLGSFVAFLQTGEWPRFEESANAMAVVFAMILAIRGGLWMRDLADETASGIEGD